MSALTEALRHEADLSEKGVAFMDDADLADETREMIEMLRAAADEIDRLQAESDTLADALNAATLALGDVGADL